MKLMVNIITGIKYNWKDILYAGYSESMYQNEMIILRILE